MVWYLVMVTRAGGLGGMLLGCIGSLLQKTTCLCIEQMNIVGSHKNGILRDWFTKEDLDRHRRREKINHAIERQNNT